MSDSKRLGVITLSGEALDIANNVRAERMSKGRYESSWNVVLAHIIREYGKHQAPENTITKTDQGVDFVLTGKIPDKTLCKSKAKEVKVKKEEYV